VGWFIDAPVDVLALCDREPHAKVRPVRQSKSERKKNFGFRFLSAPEFLTTAVCQVLRMGDNLGTELRDHRSSAANTVEKARQEAEITKDQGLSVPLVHHDSGIGTSTEKGNRRSDRQGAEA
jgi:hypothetical protein